MRHFNQHQHTILIASGHWVVRHSTWQGSITVVKTGKSQEKVFAPAGNFKLNFKFRSLG